VYASKVNDQKLTFVVSGMLWNRSLVMQDLETGSLWSHILGEAMQGKLKGTHLEQIPSVMTDWGTWRKQHPGGSVVVWNRTSRNFTHEIYARPEAFVLGIVVEGKAKAWGFDYLTKNPAVNDTFQERPVLVAFEKTSVTARMYDRKIKDRVLTFRFSDGNWTDKETDSNWNIVTGVATHGSLKGAQLTALPAIVSFRAAWKTFHPRSEIAGN